MQKHLPCKIVTNLIQICTKNVTVRKTLRKCLNLVRIFLFQICIKFFTILYGNFFLQVMFFTYYKPKFRKYINTKYYNTCKYSRRLKTKPTKYYKSPHIFSTGTDALFYVSEGSLFESYACLKVDCLLVVISKVIWLRMY